MRIAVVAPVEEPVPPPAYGGTELVVSNLVECLCERGHEVILIASGDSRTPATLVPVSPRALRRSGLAPEALSAEKDRLALAALDAIRAERPDVVHSHVWRLLALEAQVGAPAVTTAHWPLETGRYRRIALAHPTSKYASVSLSQQSAAPSLNWVANIPLGLKVETYPFSEKNGSYLAFLGRASPEKGLDTALEVARRSGVPLLIAAKVDHTDRHFFRSEIEPAVDGRNVVYLGELGAAEKRALLVNALALLHPVRFPEPFGIAVVEALACGTPVLTFRRGAMPEIIVQGVTGFVVDTIDALIAAVAAVPALSRQSCRSAATTRFTVSRMTNEYEALYSHVAGAPVSAPRLAGNTT